MRGASLVAAWHDINHAMYVAGYQLLGIEY
jgi:hypothetical protein